MVTAIVDPARSGFSSGILRGSLSLVFFSQFEAGRPTRRPFVSVSSGRPLGTSGAGLRSLTDIASLCHDDAWATITATWALCPLPHSIHMASMQVLRSVWASQLPAVH